jgi:hypothetical protein
LADPAGSELWCGAGAAAASWRTWYVAIPRLATGIPRWDDGRESMCAPASGALRAEQATASVATQTQASLRRNHPRRPGLRPAAWCAADSPVGDCVGPGRRDRFALGGVAAGWGVGPGRVGCRWWCPTVFGHAATSCGRAGGVRLGKRWADSWTGGAGSPTARVARRQGTLGAYRVAALVASGWPDCQGVTIL